MFQHINFWQNLNQIQPEDPTMSDYVYEEFTIKLDVWKGGWNTFIEKNKYGVPHLTRQSGDRDNIVKSDAFKARLGATLWLK